MLLHIVFSLPTHTQPACKTFKYPRQNQAPMNVAVLYSGGKDSNFAVQYCRERGWNIQYLLSVKPNRKDCYLFHFATVEHTRKQASLLGLKHYMIPCEVADPVQEAALVRDFVLSKEPVEAVVLGGTGLQETQLKSLQSALQPYQVEVFAAHAGLDHDVVMEDMLSQGYEIMITQVASEGLKNWLGKKITKETFGDLQKDARKHGFHIGGEGGYYDTFVLDAPLFSESISFTETRNVMDDEYCGHIEATGVKTTAKQRVE